MDRELRWSSERLIVDELGVGREAQALFLSFPKADGGFRGRELEVVKTSRMFSRQILCRSPSYCRDIFASRTSIKEVVAKAYNQSKN